VAAFWVLKDGSAPGMSFPWSPARVAISLGMLPFALVYTVDAYRNGPQSGDAETIY
jgi:hypothetical protein